jgi:hypothetical protein
MSSPLKSAMIGLLIFILSFSGGMYVGIRLDASKTEQQEQLNASKTEQQERQALALSKKSHDDGVQEGRKAMISELNKVLLEKDLIKFPLDETLSIDYPLTDVYGFVKEANANSLVLEFDTAQYQSLDAKRLEKTIMVGNDTQVSKMSLSSGKENLAAGTPNPIVGTGTGDGGSKPQSGIFMVSPAAFPDQEGSASMPQVQISTPISFSEIKKGDYVHVVSETNVMKTEGPLNAKQLIVLPLENNTYLKGEFPSYKDLPLGFLRSDTVAN